jgi:CAAX prenyl protease-like protein
MVVAMLTGAFSAGVDYLYPLRVLAVASVLWYCRSVYRPELVRPSAFAFLVGVLVFAFWVALDRWIPQPKPADSVGTSLSTMPFALAGVWMVFRIVGSVVTVPIAEELAFRGYLMRFLGSNFADAQRPVFAIIPFVVSSLLFGALHGRWLAGTLAGMCYAWAYYQRGRLADAIAAHAVTNLLLVAAAIATSDWSLWS